MRIPHILTIISAAFILTGCSILSSEEPIEVITDPTEKTPLNLSVPEPLGMKDVEWIVVTNENADEIFDELMNSGNEPVIFGVTPSGYERLSINFAEIRNYINIQRQIILRYKQYYEGSTDSPPPGSD